ncbi:hypothetical protein GALL_82530 [mine drainage metagenome]|uniref:Oligosaccharide repeat unit polymerase n=1 Tax=mine drainage metagenome TaxID=410659 RepID=A0A1J5SZG3_9ZZZZ
MSEMVGIDVVVVYLISMISIAMVLYFSFSKKTRPFNVIDSLVYELFILTNFFSVIVVLTYQGYVSAPYVLMYAATFISFFGGIYAGSRINIHVKPIFVERSIFTPKYFFPMLAFGLIAAVSSLITNAETWAMEGDAHLNRLETAHSNAAFFFFSWATANAVPVYLMLSVFICQSKGLRLLSYSVLILTVLAGLTGASRSGVLGQVYQLSLVLFILSQQKAITLNLKKFKWLILFFFILFIGGVVFITSIQEDDRSGWYTILERLVFSADAVLYFHVFLKEGFVYHLDSAWYYLLHPLLKLMGLSVIEGGVGPSMSAAFSGEMTGRGPVGTFIYDGMFVFGYAGMMVYAFFVGFFVSGTRNLLVNLVRRKLLLTDFFAFFTSIFLFFLGGVLINDLLTFVTLLIVIFPILLFLLAIILVYKSLSASRGYAARRT